MRSVLCALIVHSKGAFEFKVNLWMCILCVFTWNAVPWLLRILLLLDKMHSLPVNAASKPALMLHLAESVQLFVDLGFWYFQFKWWMQERRFIKLMCYKRLELSSQRITTIVLFTDPVPLFLETVVLQLRRPVSEVNPWPSTVMSLIGIGWPRAYTRTYVCMFGFARVV